MKLAVLRRLKRTLFFVLSTNIYKQKVRNPFYIKKALSALIRCRNLYADALRKKTLLEIKECEILLINPPKYEIGKHFPIGIGYLAAYLENQGISVQCYDSHLNEVDESTKSKEIDFIVKIIRKAHPKIVGISAITAQANSAYLIGRSIKANFPDIIVVYGGVHPSALPEDAFLNGNADYVIIGEAEATLSELAIAIQQGKPTKNILGIAYKKGDKIIANAQRPLLPGDAFPTPAYHLFQISEYNTDIHIHPYNKKIAMEVMTSRGCPYSCAYCANPFLYRRKTRFRSLPQVIQELKLLKERYGFDTIHFHDDDFLIEPKRTERLCRLIIKEQLKIKWVCLTNINNLYANLNILPLLKKSGCVGVELGIESCDEEVLKKSGKLQKISRLEAVNNALKKNNIAHMYLMMSFLPGENLDTAYNTAKMICRMNKVQDNRNLVPYLKPVHGDYVLGMLTTPYPGSELYRTAREHGIVLAQNWDVYRPEFVNFLPYSFLYDIPIKKRQIDREMFKKIVNIYKENILLHLVDDYQIHHTPWFDAKTRYDYLIRGTLFDFKRYCDFLYSLYSECDGKSSVFEVHKKMKEELSYVAVGYRFLAMFGLVRSKRKKS
ncbi:MAG: radical SAM protein [Candidatus Woesearchaeota archaeon]